MMFFKLFLSLSTFVLVYLASNAQPQFCGLTYGQCKDTISPLYAAPYLQNDFNPVCGCNGVTYKNIQNMWAQNICYAQQNNGPCEEVFMDMFPSLVSFSSPIVTFRLITRTTYSVFFQISDLLGNVYIRQNLSVQPGQKLEQSFNFGTLPKGVFIANVFSGGQRFSSIKFVAMNF